MKESTLNIKKQNKKHHFNKFFIVYELIDTSMQIYISSFLNVQLVNRLSKICKQKRNLKLNTFFIFGKSVKTTSERFFYTISSVLVITFENFLAL